MLFAVFCLVIVCDTEQLGDFVLVDMRADDTQASDDARGAVAYVCLTGDIVEVDPLTVLTCDDTLGAQNDAILNGVLKLVQAGSDLLFGELLGGFTAEALKHFVGMVMVVMPFVMVVVVMAAASTAFAVVMIVVMFMFVIIIVIVFMIMLVMMLVLMFIMLMIVATAGAVLAVLVMVIMVVMVMILMFVVVMLVFVLMIMASAGAILAVLMMMVMMVLVCQALQLRFDGVLALHGFQQLCAGELSPRGDDDGGGLVVLA